MATATGILPPVQVGPWAQDLQNFADGGAGNELKISSWLSYLLEPTARPSLHCSAVFALAYFLPVFRTLHVATLGRILDIQ